MLEQQLHENLYKNFLLFSVSVHILLNNYLVEMYSGYANDLLAVFVEHFGQIYGNEVTAFEIIYAYENNFIIINKSKCCG